MTRIGAITLKYDPSQFYPRGWKTWIVEGGRNVMADFVGAKLMMDGFDVSAVRYERIA